MKSSDPKPTNRKSISSFARMGGKARGEQLPDARLKEIASVAANQRWNNWRAANPEKAKAIAARKTKAKESVDCACLPA